MSAGQVHIRVSVAGRQGRPTRAVADLRLRHGRVSGLPGLLLLAPGARRRRVRVQPDTADQLGRVHQYVLARFRAHTGCHDGRAVQPGRQGPGAGHRVRDRVPARIRRRQDVPEPVGLVRSRHHVLDIRRVLRAGNRVRVVPGARDQEQDAAGDPERAKRQEEGKQPEGQPQRQPETSNDGLSDRRPRRDRLNTKIKYNAQYRRARARAV